MLGTSEFPSIFCRTPAFFYSDVVRTLMRPEAEGRAPGECVNAPVLPGCRRLKVCTDSEKQHWTQVGLDVIGYLLIVLVV